MQTKKVKKRTTVVVLLMHKSDAITLLEAIDTAAGIYQLLLAGEEGMALGTNFNAQILLGGTGLEDIAANTGYGSLLVLRMNALFHDFHLSRRNTIT